MVSRLHFFLPCICLASVLASEADERARLAAEAFASHPATQHLDVGPAVVIEVQLGGEFTLPSTVVKTWQFFAAKPPDLDSQRCLSSQITPTGHSDSDHSPLRGGLLVAQVAATATTVNHHEVTVAHRLELHTRRLVPGVPTADVAGLIGPLRSAATVVTPFMDWDTPQFQEWLDREHLRAEAGESDVAFARRCYRLIRTRLNYITIALFDTNQPPGSTTVRADVFPLHHRCP